VTQNWVITKRQRRRREDNGKTEERGAEKRNRGDRREGRITPPLSPPPSTTVDDHNRASPLQVTCSLPLPFVYLLFPVFILFWMQNVIHILQQKMK
jgi:hypothetical protein